MAESKLWFCLFRSDVQIFDVEGGEYVGRKRVSGLTTPRDSVYRPRRSEDVFVHFSASRPGLSLL